MCAQRSSATDPARRLALLWGSHTQPGRSGLTVKAIVTAAMQLADQAGEEAVSMRRVAERLKAGTMSLYSHVPGKDALIDLMVDTAYGELYPSVEAPSQQPGGWRDALRYIARQNWALFRRHPWLHTLAGGRPGLGPNVTLKYEAELRPLEGLGLSDVEMDAALTLLLTHVEATARAQASLDRQQRDSGLTEVEWWVKQAPVLEKVVDYARFPLASRVGQAAGEAYQGSASPEFALSFGVERILAGIDALIDNQRAP